MPDRKKLHELHVDEFGASSQRQRITIAAHVDRGAVARIEPREAPGRHDRRFRRNRHRLASRQMHRVRANAHAIAHRQLGDEQVAGAPDSGRALQVRPQCLRHRRPGVHEIDVDAARPVVPRRLHLADMAVGACPAHAPTIELADAGRRVLA